MAIRKLTNWNAESLCGNPLFRKKSRPVESFDERLWTLLDDMRETLEKVGGYGCAAVHVGILRRVVVILDDSGVIELVNPTITEISEQTLLCREGSIAPDSPQDVVRRPKSVTVSGFDRHGNAITVSGEDFLAATLCHEIDHLDGVLFTDRVVENEIDENGNECTQY